MKRQEEDLNDVGRQQMVKLAPSLVDVVCNDDDQANDQRVLWLVVGTKRLSD